MSPRAASRSSASSNAPTEGMLVCLVDDDPQFRESALLLLRSVGIEARAYASAVKFLADLELPDDRPTVILLDACMPGMSGLSLLKQLREDGVTLPIILVTGYGDVELAARAMRFGALDVVTKPVSAERLLGVIQGAFNKIAGPSRTQAVALETTVAGFERLTKRERQILLLIVKGKPNKVVARDLGVSVRTIEAHRLKIMDKLQVKSIAQLVRLSLQHLQLDEQSNLVPPASADPTGPEQIPPKARRR